MKTFRADLHIHTVLSPCADLEMSPRNIVQRAHELKLDIIGVSDHNCTLHAPLIRKLAAAHDIFVMMGAEVTTAEEIHCLAFFPDEQLLSQFQEYISEHQPRFPNDKDLFGHQVLVDEEDRIIQEIDHYLGTALTDGIEEVEKAVHRLSGIFIPAHINRHSLSVLSQLGWIPEGLRADALELYNRSNKKDFLEKNPGLDQYSFVINSDAHLLRQIGEYYSIMTLKKRSFDEITKALRKEDGRKVQMK